MNYYVSFFSDGSSLIIPAETEDIAWSVAVKYISIVNERLDDASYTYSVDDVKELKSEVRP